MLMITGKKLYSWRIPCSCKCNEKRRRCKVCKDMWRQHRKREWLVNLGANVSIITSKNHGDYGFLIYYKFGQLCKLFSFVWLNVRLFVEKIYTKSLQIHMLKIYKSWSMGILKRIKCLDFQMFMCSEFFEPFDAEETSSLARENT